MTKFLCSANAGVSSEVDDGNQHLLDRESLAQAVTELEEEDWAHIPSSDDEDESY
jgi:hypothetical protein